MAENLYFIKCLTNLHVGSGDINFNIIDNEVERDPITEYPMINASGVKGAFRQYFEENAPELTDRLFGSQVKKSQNEQSVSTPGSLKFLAASFLARPVRASKGDSPYHMVTTKTALEQLCRTVFSLTGTTIFKTNSIQQEIDCKILTADCELEGYIVNELLDMSDADNIQAHEYLKNCIEGSIVILSDTTIRKLALPVVARNYLEDGESKNLWYEEYVPHESIFWFMVLGSDNDVCAFNNVVIDKVIQFGGNASIGNGLCIVKRGGIQDVKAAN